MSSESALGEQAAHRNREEVCHPRMPNSNGPLRTARHIGNGLVLHFRVQFSANNHRHGGEPEPEQQHDHRGNATIGIFILTGAVHKRRESPAQEQSADCREQHAGHNPAFAREASQRSEAVHNKRTQYEHQDQLKLR